MNCTPSINRTPLGDIIHQKYGDGTNFFKVYSTIFADAYTVSNKFANWFKRHYPTVHLIQDEYSEEDKQIISDAIGTWNDIYSKTIEESAVNNTANVITASTFNYTSPNARIQGKKAIVNTFIDVLLESRNNHKHLSNYEKVEAVRNKIFDIAIDRIALYRANNNKSSDTDIETNTYAVKEEFKQAYSGKEGLDILKAKWEYFMANMPFGDNEIYETLSFVGGITPSTQNINLFSLIKELCDTTNDRDNGFDFVRDSLRSDERVNKYSIDIEDFGESEAEEARAEEYTQKFDDIKDTSYTEMDDHAGLNRDPLEVMDNDIKLYLSNLSKSDAAENLLGISDVYDLNFIDKEIRTIVTNSDIDTFIGELQDAAFKKVGMGILTKVVNDMLSYPDFAEKLHRTYAHNNISKLRLTISDNGFAEIGVGNPNANPKETLRSKLHNTARIRLVRLNIENINTTNTKFSSLESRYNRDKNNPDAIDINDTAYELVKTVVDMVTSVYTDLTQDDIFYYLDLANAKREQYADILNKNGKFDQLLKLVSSYSSKLKDCQIKYFENSNKLKELKRKNTDGRYDEDINKIKNDDWASDIFGTSIALADLFLPYISVPFNNNSANVYGKRGNDSINDNYFVIFFNRLSNQVVTDDGKTALDILAEQFDQTNEAVYLNIIEHTNSDGTVINKGLFRIDDDGHYKPTEYAGTLMNGFLFDGTIDNRSAAAATYDKMPEPDYMTTLFLAFMSELKNRRGFANFFMRTPSDASKNFVVNAPRISIGSFNSDDSLFVIRDREKRNRIVASNRINFDVEIEVINDNKNEDFANHTKQLYEAINRAKSNLNTVSRDVFMKHTQAMISDPDRVRETYIDGENTSLNLGQVVLYQEKDIRKGEYPVYVLYTYNPGKGDPVYYLLKGTLRKDSKKLEKARFVGFVNPPTDEKNSGVMETIDKAIEDYYTYSLDVEEENRISNDFVVNPRHNSFTMVKNLFKQELLDYITALHVIFETDENGNFIPDESNPTGIKFKHGFDINSNKHTKNLYEKYHLDGDGNLFVHDKHGKLVRNEQGTPILGGGVFNSSFFVVNTIDENGNLNSVNYGQQLFDAIVGNPFYGGGLKVRKNSRLGKKMSNGNHIDLVLTSEQESIIDDIMSKYLKDYVDTNRADFYQYQKFIPSRYFNDHNINEFLVNYLISNFTFDQLFEGNPKFYGNAIAFVKRCKEVQGSGVGQSTKNFNTSPSHPKRFDKRQLTNFSIDVTLSDGRTHTITGKTSFTAFCINNTNKPNLDAADRLAKALTNEKVLGENVCSEQEINNLMKAFLSEVKVNDAQSYITLDEWVRRIAGRGQLKQYEKLIPKLYNENEPLTKEDLENFVQIQKNFYFDKVYNPNAHTMVPRQIKNAEFVLVPRFIKGTELAVVAQFMEDNHIDQLNTQETSKAANTNVLDIWNNEGNLIAENVDKTVNPIAYQNFVNRVKDSKEEFDYSYLFTQQETKQHIGSTNKVGIQIVKKFVDNCYFNDPKLRIAKETFDEYYYENILKSAEEVCDLLDIPVTPDGNILIDDNGIIQSLNYKEFFKRMRDEAARQGLDSNTIQYLTLIEELNDKDVISIASRYRMNSGAETLMPLVASNLINKFESLAQSIFNNGVTRQKFPGYHGPQTTAVGWQAYDNKQKIGAITDATFNEKDNQTYAKRLQYHPLKRDTDGVVVEAHIGILIPRSIFPFKRTKVDENGNTVNKTDSELLQELEDAGLREHIIYRIPTEGKQSVALAYIAGFIDDGYGSTVVVPEDWVRQTGSDMDFDSIYSMVWETLIDKDGHIQKVQEPETLTEEDKQRLYKDYLKSKLNRYAERDDIYKEDSNGVVLVDNNRHYLYDDVKFAMQYRKLNNQIKDYNKELKNLLRKLKRTKDKNLTKEYVEQINLIGNQQKLAKEALEKFVNDYTSKIDESSNGIMSYSKFETLPDSKIVSREVRNNRMLQAMIDIISNPHILKENINTSHSDDIVENMNNIVDSTENSLRKSRDVHNILHMAKFQAEYMSGRALKGISVSLDNTISISNVVHGRLKRSLCIVYDSAYTDTEKSRDEHIKVYGTGYDINHLKETFKHDAEDLGNGKIRIRHMNYGWSYNNKNVIGNVGTIDGSETTAYILDIAKLGGIPNVDEKTFDVFKLFSSLFSDYNAAVSFIYQPAIREIFNALGENKSVFINADFNAVHTAIKRIAKNLLDTDNYIIDDQTPIDEIIDKITGNEYLVNCMHKILDFNNIEEIDLKEMLSNDLGQFIDINPRRLRDRIQNVGEFAKDTDEIPTVIRKAIFDLGVVLQYAHVKSLASYINTVAQVINPDSFGAKADIYSTNEVFERIYDMLDSDEGSPLVTDTGEDFIRAIYPNIDSVKNEDGTIDRTKSLIKFVKEDHHKESAYPSQYAFLRLASGLSILVNRHIFPTQSAGFREQISRAVSGFTHGKKITPELNKDLEKYIVNHIICKSSYLRLPCTLDNEGEVTNTDEVLTDSTSKNSDTTSLDILEQNERKRLFGFNYPHSVSIETNTGKTVEETGEEIIEEIPFEVSDFNVTMETIDKNDLANYLKLTPAQKLSFVQNYVRTPLLNALVPTLYSMNSRYADRHLITFQNNTMSKEEIFKEINDLYFNKNPYVKLLALDLVKYAYIVEGYKLGMSRINSAISNVILLNTSKGRNSIVDDIIKNFNNIDIDESFINYDKLYERYYQSHIGMPQIVTRTISKVDKKFFINPSNKGLLQVSKANKQIITKYSIGYERDTVIVDQDNIKYNRYVKLKNGTRTTLYRIEADNANFVYLIPLNKFEENEDISSDFSVNENNNIYKQVNYYEDLVEEVNKNNVNIFDAIDNYSEEQEAKYTFVRPEHKDSIGYINLRALANSEEEQKKFRSQGYIEAEQDIIKLYKDKHEDKTIHYINNDSLASRFKVNGNAGHGFIELSIPINGEYVKRTFKVTRCTQKFVREQVIPYLPNQKYATKAKPHSHNPGLNTYINRLRSADTSLVSTETLIRIEPQIPKVEGSAVGDAMLITFRGIKNNVQNNYLDADKTYQSLRHKGFYESATNLEKNPEEFYKVVTNYAQKEASIIKDKLINFATYPTDDGGVEVLSIDDPRVIELITKDKNIRDDFQQTLLRLDTFIKHYKNSSNILSETVDNDKVKEYVDVIKNLVIELENNTNKDTAIKNYLKLYLPQKSNNQFIHDGTIDIMEGFYATSMVESWLADVQESPNPIIQLTYKEISRNLTASTIKGKELAIEFVDKWEAIEQEAIAKGEKIDINKFIDKYGNFKVKYTPEFKEKYVSLIEKVSEIANDPNKGEHTMEYLNALIELKKFKLANIEQPIVEQYYIDELKALEGINKPEFKLVYEAYEKLRIEKRDYIREHSPEVDGDNYFDTIRRINNQMLNLTSSVIKGANKTTPDDPSNPFNGDEAIIYSAASAKAIREFVQARNELGKYYEQKELVSFRETLQKHLNIINIFESQNFGQSKENRQAAAALHPEYQESIKWVYKNATFVLTPKAKKELEQAYKVLTGTKTSIEANIKERVASILRDPKYKDVIKYKNNVIDYDSIPDEVLDKIREIENSYYKNQVVNNIINERTLINSAYANTAPECYSAFFYNQMTYNTDIEDARRDNAEWQKTVNEINDILKPYYFKTQKYIDFSNVDLDTLKKLGDLYEKLLVIRKKTVDENSLTDAQKEELARIHKFMSSEVRTSISPQARAHFREQLEKAKEKGSDYFNAWIRVNCEPIKTRIVDKKTGKAYVVTKVKNGHVQYVSDKNRLTPSAMVYGKLVPKHTTIKTANGVQETRNTKKEQAIATLMKYTKQTVKPEYTKTYNEKLALGKDVFNEWYQKNHVYNPYTHEMEPISIWKYTTYQSFNEDTGMTDQLVSDNFEANRNSSERVLKESSVNDNYEKGYGLYHNFKQNAESQYINDLGLNDSEQKILKLIQDTIIPLGKTNKAKRFFGRGNLVYKAKAKKNNNPLKVAGKIFGFDMPNDSNKEWIRDEDIDFAFDSEIDMPFMQMLEDSRTNVNKMPKRPNKNTLSEEEYEEAYAKYLEEKKAYDENKRNVHAELLDRDYKSVLSEFIQSATYYNAVQDCKANMFFTQKLLKSYEVFTHDNFSRYFKRLRGQYDTDEGYTYEKQFDENAYKLYNNYIRRVVYDVWRENHGFATKLTKYAQAFTSDKYMMANIYGGINNVLVGWTSMLAETNAGRYFDYSSSYDGSKEYSKGLVDYINNFFTGKFTTKQAAIIDLFDVVDYDELNGVLPVEWDGNTAIKKFRSLLFSANTIGEHGMQNSALFAMLYSNRLIKVDNPMDGEPKFAAMSEAEYLDHVREEAFKSILTEEQLTDFLNFKKRINADKQYKERYVEFKNDYIQDYLMNRLLKNKDEAIDLQKRFNDAEKSLTEEKKKEFLTKPRFIDCLAFDKETGKLSCTDVLADNNLSGDDKLLIISDFSNKVKSVNKKIHGVYDKIGAARLEKTLLGSLAMQYHKHIYPGIMKRYRRRGMYNESRNSIEMGGYASIMRFLRAPIDQYKHLSKEERDSLTSLQKLIKTMTMATASYSMYYRMMPSYQRENIRRQLGDIAGVAFALLATAIIRVGIDKDEPDEDIQRLRGAMIYTLDRMDSETFMWNPYGLFREAKTLWNQPLAVEGICSDIFDALGFYTDALFDDEFNMIYTSGPHSGENKVAVRALRNIPVYRIGERWLLFNKQDRYHKPGGNGIGQTTVKHIIED